MGAFDLRPRFFEGQYLSAADLSAVVDYLRASQSRHVIGAHTWGIAFGLNLVERPAPGAPNRREVILLPGFATDGFGRNLVAQQPTRLSESLFAAIPYQASLDSPALPGGPLGRLVKVWIAYTEIGGRPPAPGFELCDGGNSFSRTEESFEFVIGDVPDTAQRTPVTIGAETVDARQALIRFDAGAPQLFDTSVPHQTFPAGDKPPRWLVPIGIVRWVAGQGTLGHFINRDLVATAHVTEAIRAMRRYGGIVTETIEAADQAIVLRRRSDPPDDPHRFANLLTSGQSIADLLADLVWVEGGLRAEGDVKLAGSRLLLRNPDGLHEGTELYFARYGDSSGAAGRRELRAVIGTDQQADNRFVVGPERTTAPPPGVAPPPQAPSLVVMSGQNAQGRVGVNMFDPARTVHVRGDAVRLEDATGAKRIEMRTDGGAVDLQSDTHKLYLRSSGPAATSRNQVIINPFKGVGDGAVGIGTENPAHGLDVDEASVRFKLDSGNGGQLVMRSEPTAAARDKIYLEASTGAGGAPSPELRITGPVGNVPMFAAYADTTYLTGRVGVNAAAPALDTQVHVRGPRIRLESVDGSRSVDLRADGGAVDLQSSTNDLYLRSTNPGAGPGRNIVMNPYAGDGNVGIGLDSPQEKLHVHASFMRVDGSANQQAVFGAEQPGAVTVGTRNGLVSLVEMRNLAVPFSTTNPAARLSVWCRTVLELSDMRAKTRIRAISGALEQVGRLRGVAYQWRDEAAHAADGERLGLIAQEVEKIVPQAVVNNERGVSIAYSALIPVLIEAVKELKGQVEALEARVSAHTPARSHPKT
jgi:Chaperone of endosialidase